MCAGLEEPQESLTEEALSWPWSESDMTEEGSERCSISFFLFFLNLKKCIIYFGHAVRHVGSFFPYQRTNLYSLQWKHRVPTTVLPGKSQEAAFLILKVEEGGHEPRTVGASERKPRNEFPVQVSWKDRSPSNTLIFFIFWGDSTHWMEDFRGQGRKLLGYRDKGKKSLQMGVECPPPCLALNICLQGHGKSPVH